MYDLQDALNISLDTYILFARLDKNRDTSLNTKLLSDGCTIFHYVDLKILSVSPARTNCIPSFWPGNRKRKAHTSSH